jgi:hypothetical protein
VDHAVAVEPVLLVRIERVEMLVGAVAVQRTVQFFRYLAFYPQAADDVFINGSLIPLRKGFDSDHMMVVGELVN